MRKYAAVILTGWITRCYESTSACGIIQEAEEVQDFGCLIRMGREVGNEKDQKELTKLERFMKKYYNGSLRMSDIKNLDIHLSVGDIICLETAEKKEDIEKLKTKYPAMY